MRSEAEEARATGNPRRAEGGWSGLSASWRRQATSSLEDVIWRATRSRAMRRARRSEPVAVRQALAEGRSILVIAGEGLPGVVAALPAIRALRRMRRETRLDLLGSPLAEPLLARDSLVDHVLGDYPLPPLWQWRAFRRAVERIAAGSYEVVFAFDQRRDRTLALAARMTGARLRVCFGEEEGHPFFNVQVVPQDPHRYLPNRNLVLLGTLGVDIGGLDCYWELPLREREVAERLLEVKQLKGRQPLVAFDTGPGMEDEMGVTPPMDRLAEAVLRRTGARGILLSESVQREISPRGLSQGESRELGLSGLREALGVLSCCHGFVGRNTSFFHLAVALRVPAVGLFPAEVPPWWRPRHVPGVMLLEAGAPAEENAERAGRHLNSVWAAQPSGAGR